MNLLQFDGFTTQNTTSANQSESVLLQCLPSNLDVLAGLLSSLTYIVTRHQEASDATRHEEPISGQLLQSVKVAKRPDAWEDPQLFALDP